MRKIDQEKRAIAAEERQKRVVDHIRQIAAAVEMWLKTRIHHSLL